MKAKKRESDAEDQNLVLPEKTLTAGRKAPAAVSTGSGLEGFVHTAFSEWWDTSKYDLSLRNALHALRMVNVDCFVVKIAGRSLLSYSVPRSKSKLNLLKLRGWVDDFVARSLEARLWTDEFQQLLEPDYRIAIKRIPVRKTSSSCKWNGTFCSEDRELSGLGLDDLNYCAYSYQVRQAPEIEGLESPEILFARHFAQTICLVLFDLFRNREHRLAAFPKEVSERYWTDSASSMRSRGSSGLSPPWEELSPTGYKSEGHRTATLSIDLRRSTFCMEQADHGWQFGAWLDQLVKILTAVTHRNGGVFDKFTGDGALVHFLERECCEVYRRHAVAAAVQCAIEMQAAVTIHLKKLREFLRFDSQQLGAGVAIDMSEAFWSIDGGDSPIVVGRGVVGACRLGGGAPAGSVRLSNIAWTNLDSDFDDEAKNDSSAIGRVRFGRVKKSGLKARLEGIIHSVSLKTKEWTDDMGVRAWEFASPIVPSPEIAELCQAVYAHKISLSLGR